MQRRAIYVALGAAALGLILGGQPCSSAAGLEAARTVHVIPPPEARVDINRASMDELMKVPGMTRTWAERIVRFRPYHSKLDLLQRGVITSKVYDRIKDYVIAHRVKR